MRQIILFIAISISFYGKTQYDGNTTPDYPSLIKIYEQLAQEHKEIELFNMGESDYGLPIYLCVINGAQDSIKTFEKAKMSTTIMINNAIHPGEPDGVNACLIWINKWIKNGKSLDNLPVLGIIPAYNVGGMMNRSGTSRANQNGPEEYGFRGNAQNLDLNRDFIKSDSKNMFTFAKIYHELDPDVFLDTHVSNGADYQYVMTYIASVRERMAPGLADLMHDQMIPYMKKKSSQRGFDLIPYVHVKKETPESGIQVFNDLPRYAMGYASLFNSISFTLETHMLKPFPQRVQATLVFIDETIKWASKNRERIEAERNKAYLWDQDKSIYNYNYKLTDKKDSVKFKGFEYSHPTSEVTQQERLKYHQDRPYEKFVPYYHEYKPLDSIEVPALIIVGRQCNEVIERLTSNQVELQVLEKDSTMLLTTIQIDYSETGKRPYEGHFSHSKIKKVLAKKQVSCKKGDVLISMDQPNRRFIMSVLVPDSPDSYFVWNMFDSYIQQKEYFSPYVFEDKAKEILENNPEIKVTLELTKKENEDFENSSWEQLYFIYRKSEFYEPSHNILPIYLGYSE